MLNVESTANTRLSLRPLSIIFLVVVSFVLIDVAISSLVDVYYDFITSPAGISLFVVETGVLFGGTYVILRMTENKIRGLSIRRTYEDKIAKGVWIVYYLMIVIMAFVIFQLFFSSEYYTGLLSIAPTISYGLAIFVLGLLAYHFFSWFLRNRALVVLLYGLASISASIYVGLIAIIFYIEIFIHQPAVTTPESSASFPPTEPGLEEFLIITLLGVLTATTFLSFWGGTIAILYSNIRRIGKTRFWILVTTPIIFFLGSLIVLYPGMQGATNMYEDNPNSIIIPLYITTFSQVAAIALFATAFVSMARALPHHQIRDYMYITCYGLTLFSIGITATVSGAGYPPFGLPTVSLVGPFSFLLLESLVWTTRIIRWVLDRAIDGRQQLGVANGRLESEDFKKFENMMHDKIQELEIEPEDSDTTREKEVLRDEIDTFKCVLGHLFNLKSDGDEAQTIRIRETNSKFQQTDHERKQLIKTEINAQIQRS